MRYYQRAIAAAFILGIVYVVAGMLWKGVGG